MNCIGKVRPSNPNVLTNRAPVNKQGMVSGVTRMEFDEVRDTN